LIIFLLKIQKAYVTMAQKGQKMKIAIDLDRTVFACKSIIYYIANKYKLKDTENNPLEYQVVDVSKVGEGFDPLFFLKLKNPNAYWEIDGAVETLKKWNERGYEITFLSSRPNFKGQQRSAVYWMAKHGIKYDNLVLACKNKAQFCKKYSFDLLIDDMIHNCNSARKVGMDAIWIENEKNKFLSEYKHDGVLTARNWDDVDKHVVRIENFKQNIK